MTMICGIRLKKITVNDGTVLELKPGSILIVTGPNNCGKSHLLRDIFNIDYRGTVVSDKSWEVVGTIDDIIKESASDANIRGNESILLGNFYASGKILQNFLSSLGQNYQFRNAVLQSCMKYINTFNRLSAIQSSPPIEPNSYFNVMALPNSIRQIFENLNIENEFYERVARAFTKGVLIDRYTFQSNKLHFFDKNKVDERTDRGSEKFAQWFSSQPLLDVQGDGLRSFCAVLLTVMTNIKPTILIDEPEAFLHPPQARRLAKEIA